MNGWASAIDALAGLVGASAAGYATIKAATSDVSATASAAGSVYPATSTAAEVDYTPYILGGLALTGAALLWRR